MYNRRAAGSHFLMTSQNPTHPAHRAVNSIERHPRLTFAVIAILLAMQITPKLTMSPDGVSYMSIARSLISHGQLIRLGSPHIRYAPAYPILISPAFFLGPRPFLAVQIIQWLYAILLILGVYAWFAAYAGRSAIWITLLALLNTGFWDLFRQVSSELAFMPCLMWGSVLLAAAIKTPSLRRAATMMAGAILLVAIATLTRQAGALLVIGFALALIVCAVRRQITWPRAIAFAAAVGISIAIVSWGLIAFDHHGAHQAGPAEISYTDAFRAPNDTLPSQILEGIRRQSAEVGRLLIPGMWKAHAVAHGWHDLNTWIYLAFCVPIAIGWWKLCKTTADPLALTLPFYIALYVVYPFDSGTRFTVPMLPVLAASLWFLLSPLANNRTSVFLLLILLHTSVAIGYWIDDAAHVRHRWQHWSTIQKIASAIPPTAKIIALRGGTGDDWMFLMCLTDRPVAPESLNEPLTKDADWIVTSNPNEFFPGFHPITQVTNYKIETRDTPTAPK
jgi:4-amino-4-deoxy-L-arabinose transferase-like glycosyltransferase